MTGLSTSAIQRRIEQQCKQPSGEIAVSDSQATKPAAATDAGRNPIYEGQFDGETPEQAAHRLHWAKAGLAMGRDVAADQHARDIAVLRRLCAERDQLRAELAALKAQHEQDAQTIKVLQAMARQLKAQPSGVVLSDEELWSIRNQVAINEVLRDDDSVKICVKHGRAIEQAVLARLNSSPVSAGDDRETIRAVFLRNGFTIKGGQADLKPYVYAAADELMSIARAALSAPSHGEQVRDGWAVSLMGPDEVVRIQRKDGKWCGVTHLSESPRDRLLYEFLRTIAAPSAGSQKEKGE